MAVPADLDAMYQRIFDVLTGPNRATSGQAEIDQLQSEAAERGDRHTQFAVDFVASIVDDLDNVAATSGAFKLERAESMYRQATELGWPRLEAIAEARALFWRSLLDPEQRAANIATLRRRIAESPPSLDLADRFWYDHTIAVVLAYEFDYTNALNAAIPAADIALASGVRLYQCETANNLAYLFTRVADFEGALPVVEAGLEAAEAGACRPFPLVFNALLTYTMTERFERATQVLDANPWFTQVAEQSITHVRTLVALLKANIGELDEAVELAEIAPAPNLRPSIRHARSWMIPRVLLLAGRVDDAHRMLADFMETNDISELGPFDATQVFATLSDVLETRGDVTGALRALRESQARCYTWVAESVVSRLQAIQGASADVSTADDEAWRQRAELVHTSAARAGDALGRTEAQATSNDGPDPNGGPGAEPPIGILHHVTHDMRNSLQGVVGMISMLQLSNLDDKQRRYTEIADASAHTLLALCNDVLDLARINAGRLTLQPATIDVRDEISEVVAPVAVHCSQRGVDVRLEIDATVPSSLSADALRFKQVVLNLLTNAAKFTAEGTITVSMAWSATDASSGWLTTSVQDTGPGIEPDLLPTLFDEFIQVGAQPAGSGLGLAVSRELVELMGGHIEARSVVGTGSTFSFRLPLQMTEPGV